MKPLRMAITGVHGYASVLTNMMIRTRAVGAPVELVAVTAPDLDQHPERLAELAAHGIQPVPTYDQVLQRDDIDAVWLPLPIHLHRAFTERALAAGKPVMCEKPVAATVDDCDAMIAARDRAGISVAVGFGAVYDPATLAIKRRLREGVVGAIQRVTVLGCWPRSRRYYQRSGWPGKVRYQGAWVLDSPVHNALAHYIQLPLFWLGPTDADAANPARVQAELYRVNPIENYDTCTLRFTVDAPGEPTLLVAMTHAVEHNRDVEIVVHGDHGTLTWTAQSGAVVRNTRGEELERFDRHDQNMHMVTRFAQLVRGEPNPDVAVATLEASRPQVVAANGASQAAPVIDVPDSAVRESAADPDDPLKFVPGLEAVLRRCLETDQMLHASGQVGWSAPPGELDLRGYDHFDGGALLDGAPTQRA